MKPRPSSSNAQNADGHGESIHERNQVSWALQFGVLVPNFGNCCGSPRELAELAVEAEESGWDGFFIFDHILYSNDEHVPLADPWVALAAIAMNTKRMRIGPLVTPLARRRPWKLARETVSIDHLSKGRLTLGVGLGDPAEVEFTSLGENGEDRVRAEKLDEGLEVLVGLWRGEPFSYLRKALRGAKCSVPAPTSSIASNSYLGGWQVAEKGTIPSRRPMGRRVPPGISAGQ